MDAFYVFSLEVSTLEYLDQMKSIFHSILRCGTSSNWHKTSRELSTVSLKAQRKNTKKNRK